MSDYVPTDWVDNVTPVDESRMDHLEAGVDANRDLIIGLDGRVDTLEADDAVAVRNSAIAIAGNDWDNADVNGWFFGTDGANAPAAFAGLLVIGRVERTAATITQTVWAPATVTSVLAPQYVRRFASASWGPWILFESGGGGSSIEYENAWSAVVDYDPGMVVIHNGVEYLAVNPSLNEEPPAPASPVPGVISLVTALPSSPFDGQEVIFTDSLTSPTYTWRLRYVAAKATNKWVFIGGAPIVATAEAVVGVTATTLSDAVGGPSITVPLVGDYEMTYGWTGFGSGSGIFNVTGLNAGGVGSSATELVTLATAATIYVAAGRTVKMAVAGTRIVKVQYRTSSGTATFLQRDLAITPIAVGG